jgi:tripartite-type tricarboxylate transporter receptor subunit TctC
MKNVSTLKCLLVAIYSLLAAASQAQNYPQNPIKIIVPYSAGGPTDAAARIFAERLGDKLRQPVIIQNLLGGGGLVGTEVAARAAPDGYTLYFGANSMAIYPFVKPAESSINFQATDFAAIGGIATSAHVLLASKNSGITSMSDLVQKAKTANEAVSYGSAGAGGSTHLPLAFFEKDAGIKLLHVPYKGAAPAFVDLLASRIDLSTPGYSAALNEPIQSGKVIALAVTSDKRLPFLPNVPTGAESGYPNMVFPIWYALFGPKGTPPFVVERLSQEMKAMSAEPDYVKKLAAQGNVAEFVSPKELDELLARQTVEMGKRIGALNLKF